MSASSAAERNRESGRRSSIAVLAPAFCGRGEVSGSEALVLRPSLPQFRLRATGNLWDRKFPTPGNLSRTCELRKPDTSSRQAASRLAHGLSAEAFGNADGRN